MTQEQVLTLNHNSAQCIKSVHNWGETKYQNICSGEYMDLAWGHVDYFFAVLTCALAVLAMVFIVFVIKELRS